MGYPPLVRALRFNPDWCTVVVGAGEAESAHYFAVPNQQFRIYLPRILRLPKFKRR